MCTHNPEIQTNTGSSTMFNLGQMLDVLSVPSGQSLMVYGSHGIDVLLVPM